MLRNRKWMLLMKEASSTNIEVPIIPITETKLTSFIFGRRKIILKLYIINNF